MQQNFQKAKELIDRSYNILLTMHERMDGDDGGALLAITHHLKSTGKQAVCAIKKGVPPSLSFLPGSKHVREDIGEEEFDLLVAFGCSDKNRIGNEKITGLDIAAINIDHHPDNTNFGDVNLVDAGKSSVAELVYDFFKFCKWQINKDVATCLLTGIITDTGSFMHSNTKTSTLQAAADLMRQGALANKIIKHTYHSKSPNILKAWGKAMENSYYDAKHKVIFSIMTEDDLKETGKLPQAAFDGFAVTLNSVPEAKFAMFLRQEGNIVKGSLRSESYKNVDVSKIAKLFGGGGHKQAAGFSIPGRLTRDKNGKWKIE
ncbi:MAG: bifunctional oligoribonuclease/PAP phosphatase NrnA [Patescibacteria group bacterium]|nr:bifunctional oligoribonuclease/PAP phosphatase NrnA [Patescibacteria group bacterium]